MTNSISNLISGNSTESKGNLVNNPNLLPAVIATKAWANTIYKGVNSSAINIFKNEGDTAKITAADTWVTVKEIGSLALPKHGFISNILSTSGLGVHSIRLTLDDSVYEWQGTGVGIFDTLLIGCYSHPTQLYGYPNYLPTFSTTIGVEYPARVSDSQIFPPFSALGAFPCLEFNQSFKVEVKCSIFPTSSRRDGVVLYGLMS